MAGVATWNENRSWVGLLVAIFFISIFELSRNIGCTKIIFFISLFETAVGSSNWCWTMDLVWVALPYIYDAKYTHDIWYLTNFSKSIFCPNLTNIFFSVAVNLLNALKWTALTSLLLVWVALSSFPGHQILQLSLSTRLLSLAIYTHTKTASDCLLVCSICFYLLSFTRMD